MTELLIFGIDVPLQFLIERIPLIICSIEETLRPFMHHVLVGNVCLMQVYPDRNIAYVKDAEENVVVDQVSEFHDFLHSR